MIRIWALLLLTALIPAYAQETDPYAADRQAMRKLLAEVESALNNKNFPAALSHLTNNVLISYYNGEVTTTPQGAADYFSRMLSGPSPVVQEYQTKAEVTDHAIFYGDTAIAHGTTQETYKLTDGLNFSLKGLWTATLVKTEGAWKIAALHFSANLFDNPLVHQAWKATLFVGILAVIAGIIAGVFIGRGIKR